ncbi:hypothetical protein HID58_094075, partial [Brassica napus]
GRLYGRPYGLYGPVRMRSTRNIFSQPSEDIWCLCKNRAQGYGLRIMVSKEHQEDAVCNGNLRELAHGSDWLMIVQDRLDVAGKKETKAGYVSGQRYGQIHKAVWSTQAVIQVTHQQPRMECSMGHYAIRRVTCEALYGDSNTLVPGIRKRAAHKTETITTLSLKDKPMYLDFSPKELRHCVHIESGTCDLDRQPLGDGCDTYRDYLREDQVESQAVSVPKMSRYKGMCTSEGCFGSSLSFSKEAVKSVERERFQTWSMKRASRGRLYGRPYGLYGPVRMRSTRNIFSQPSEDIWCLWKNRAQGYGLRSMCKVRVE